MHSADILLRTLVVSVWCCAPWNLIALSFPLVTLDIHIAALYESTLLWDANVAATVEAAEASLWTVCAEGGHDEVICSLVGGFSSSS